jgi:hypothetical protein
MESSTNDEIKTLLEKWNSAVDSSDGILEVRNAFALPAAKIIWKMMVGRLEEKDLANMKELLEKAERMTEGGTFGPGLMMIAPFLKYFAPNMTGHTVMANFMEYGKRVASVS